MTTHTCVDIISSATFDTFCNTQYNMHARNIPLVVSGCGKKEMDFDWSMVRPAKSAPVNLKITGPVPTDSRQ